MTVILLFFLLLGGVFLAAISNAVREKYYERFLVRPVVAVAIISWVVEFLVNESNKSVVGPVASLLVGLLCIGLCLRPSLRTAPNFLFGTGVALNGLVVIVNGFSMPVMTDRQISSLRHSRLTGETAYPFLADIIPDLLGSIVSIGDVLLFLAALSLFVSCARVYVREQRI